MSAGMDRVNRIITGEEYQQYLLKNRALEDSRTFCHHNFEHMLAVARLTYLLLLERGTRHISKEMAYAAGLLHDIGRYRQYRDGTCHALHSAALAGPLLEGAGFSPEERELIVTAIAEHRRKEAVPGADSPLSDALREADLHARLCFWCPALKDCQPSSVRPTAEGLLY